MKKTDTLIIGGGLSGLTVAHKLRVSCYGHRFALLEKTATTGGVIRSFREKGFIAENGPHGFLDNCRESVQILEETGLHQEAIKSPLLNFVRYVLLDGRLRMIPQTPAKIIAAPLIPWKAKFRVLGDIFRPVLDGEPTVAKWVQHRFGDALLPFADAVFTGTYAGDMDRLAIDAVMPGIRKLEKEHGSVIRGAFARAKKPRTQAGSGGFTMPAMTSFPQGMDRLPERLTEFFTEGEDLFTSCAVHSLQRHNDMWLVESEKGEFTADNVVLALPANTALDLLRGFSPPPLGKIPESWIVTVVFGFGPGNTLPPGFGYLTPEQEKRFSLGTLFSSNMFPGRAPSDHILFETLIGGRRHPDRVELSDQELVERALEDVREVLQLKGSPVYTKVLRPWGPIPQLEDGYTSLLRWRDELCSQLEGLHVCGFGWEGIGLNDMMKHGVHIADTIKAGTESRRKAAEVKGVYF